MYKKLTQQEFIQKAKLIHGNKYDYSKIEYINTRTKICIICPEHGEFLQFPNNHLKGSNCKLCSFLYRTSNTENFIKKAKKIHDNKYDYSQTIYKHNKIKTKIICYKHGEFYQTPNAHLKNNGCPKCQRSKGEEQISKWLTQHNISFETQKRFNECKNKRSLPFDFYLPKHNICIEYDGRQHFEIVKDFGGKQEFQKILIKDKIKNNFCKNNKIIIIRIPFTKLNNITTILSHNII